jgi:hypothetical protein
VCGRRVAASTEGPWAATLAAALGILWLLGDLSGVFLWLASGFLAVAVLVPLTVLWMRSHGSRRLPRRRFALSASGSVIVSTP